MYTLNATDRLPQVSVVLPVFNEAANLPPLLSEIRAAMEPLGIDYEIIAVDDGSSDGSLATLLCLAGPDTRLRVLWAGLRSGQSAALAAGMRAARAEVVVTLDADLQNDPRDIPRMLELLPACDVVSGVRRDRRDSLVRRISSRVANGVRQRLLDDGVRDVGCSLKAYRREVLAELPVFQGMHRFLPALARMRGARIREIDVNHRPRLHGRSNYGVGNRLGRGIVDLLGVLWLKHRRIELSKFREAGRESRRPAAFVAREEPGLRCGDPDGAGQAATGRDGRRIPTASGSKAVA